MTQFDTAGFNSLVFGVDLGKAITTKITVLTVNVIVALLGLKSFNFVK